MKRALSLFILMCICAVSNAQDFDKSGIYYYSDGEYKDISPIQYSKTRGKATGLYSGKVRREYSENISNNVVGPTPEFYFSYKSIPEGFKRQYYAFFISDSPKDMVLAKFTQKERKRHLYISRINSFTGTVISTADDLDVKSIITNVSDGVFKVVFDKELEPGEYCFMLHDPNGSLSDGYVFDFSVGGRNMVEEKSQTMKKERSDMYF